MVRQSLGRVWRQVVGKHAGRQLRSAVVNRAIGAINGGGQAEAYSGAGLYSGRGMYSGRGLYSGRGAYTRNALVRGGRPAMRVSGSNNETQSIIISHSEYLQDIYGPTSAQFSSESWDLNPGIAENFPWLSQIAMNYEEYQFEQLLFHFKPTVDVTATNNSSGATGTIIMATNYNPEAAAFVNKETMMQYHGANSGRVVDRHTHGVECDPRKNSGSPRKFVRSLPVLQSGDASAYDHGKFQLALVNLPSAFFNQAIGELWVTYKVRLMKPRLYSGVGGAIQECRFVNIPSTNLLSTNLFAAGIAPMQQNSFPITLANSPLDGTSYTNVFSQAVLPTASLQTTAGAAVTLAQTGYVVTFPDYLSGLFELSLYVEGERAISYADPAISILGPGNGTFVEYADMYAWGQGIPTPATLSTIDSPTYFNCACTSKLSSSSSITNGIIFQFRFFLRPALGGSDNRLQINIPQYRDNGGTDPQQIYQWQLIIRSQNANFAQSNTNYTPLYINNLGVPIDPASAVF